jgi:predicted XRE-type DNA-binding protein
MTTAAEIAARQQRDDAIRLIVEALTYRARDPNQIGIRAVLLDYALRSPEDRDISQRELAEQLGIGESSVSERLEAAAKILESVRDPKFQSTESKSDLGSDHE